MRRYRYKKRARAFKQTFQWFFDLSTIPDEMQIMTVSAGGEYVKQRLKPFFGAFKYYKLGQVRLKMIPASTLPVDPTGLSYEAGDNLVDPRDQLTPGLTRITNGEDMFEDLTGLDAETQRKIYYTMMLDRRWFKWQLQSGLRRKASPRYWQIGQLHQDYFPGAIQNLPVYGPSPQDPTKNGIVGTGTQTMILSSAGANRGLLTPGETSKYGIFQTGHKGRLGWMPTDALTPEYTAQYDIQQEPLTAAVPEVECFKIILPPAFKTKYYYRCFVTETVYFKGAITNDALFEDSEGTYPDSYQSLDRFVRNLNPVPRFPSYPQDYAHMNPIPNNDGGTGNITEYPEPPEPEPEET